MSDDLDAFGADGLPICDEFACRTWGCWCDTHARYFRCPASTSGMCLELVESSKPCPAGECDRTPGGSGTVTQETSALHADPRFHAMRDKLAQALQDSYEGCPSLEDGTPLTCEYPKGHDGPHSFDSGIAETTSDPEMGDACGFAQTALSPVRSCCGQRHEGAVCPDLRVRCCLCFHRFPIEALHQLPDGTREDVCWPCAIADVPFPNAHPGPVVDGQPTWGAYLRDVPDQGYEICEGETDAGYEWITKAEALHEMTPGSWIQVRRIPPPATERVPWHKARDRQHPPMADVLTIKERKQ